MKRKLGDCLIEVTRGVGADWHKFPVLGATRDGLALAKEPVGKSPERYKYVAPGTVFYNPMRIMIGSIAMLDDGDEPGITSPDYVVLRAREGVLHPRWFYYWLRSRSGEELIKSLARGAVRERMMFNRLAVGEIELPSWEHQVRAAQQLLEVAQARAAVKSQLEATQELGAGFIRVVFGDDNAQRWVKVPLGELCIDSGQYGTSEKSSGLPVGVPVLGMGNLFDGKIIWENLNYMRLRSAELAKYSLAPGDLLFNRTNSAELVGKSAVFDGSREAIFAS